MSFPSSESGTPLDLDLTDTRRWLAAVTGSEHASVTWQAWGPPGCNSTLHGPLEKHERALGALNVKGANIAAMVNAGDGKGRKKGNVTDVRAVFVDLDGAPLDPVIEASKAMPPHLVVQSSPGRFHVLWRVTGCDLADFGAIQRGLAKMFGGDESITDTCRVLRVAGFVRHKTGMPTSVVAVQHSFVGPAYDIAELCAGLGVAPEQAVGADGGEVAGGNFTVTEGNRNSALFRFASKLHREGRDAADVLLRVESFNAERCKPPLPCEEVKGIVDRATAYERQGEIRLSVNVVDDPAFALLPAPAAKLFWLALRRYATAQRPISLTMTDVKGWDFKTPRVLSAAIGALLGAGLLTCERQPRQKRCGLYIPRVTGRKS